MLSTALLVVLLLAWLFGAAEGQTLMLALVVWAAAVDSAK